MSQSVHSLRWRRPARWGAFACAALATLALLIGEGSQPRKVGAQGLGPLVLHFVDVGDGDATWITLPDGETALVDCGPARSSKQLVLRLQAAGVVRLDQLILSQSSANAVGGCADVLGQIVVRTITWSGLSGDPKVWGPLQAQIAYYGLTPQVLPAATPQNAGGATLTAFQRPPIGTPDDQFDSSMVLLVEYAGWRSLLPGGIHANGEDNAVSTGLAYPIHILSTPDGGSTVGGSDRFLQQLFRPDLGSSCRVAVSSQGPDRRGAPTAATIRDRLRTWCPQVYVTAESGSVVVQVAADGSAPQISSER